MSSKQRQEEREARLRKGLEDEVKRVKEWRAAKNEQVKLQRIADGQDFSLGVLPE